MQQRAQQNDRWLISTAAKRDFNEYAVFSDYSRLMYMLSLGIIAIKHWVQSSCSLHQQCYREGERFRSGGRMLAPKIIGETVSCMLPADAAPDVVIDRL